MFVYVLHSCMFALVLCVCFCKPCVIVCLCESCMTICVFGVNAHLLVACLCLDLIAQLSSPFGANCSFLSGLFVLGHKLLCRVVLLV